MSVHDGNCGCNALGATVVGGRGEQLNADIACRAAMFALDGLLLDQHLVGAAKLLGNVAAALALGLIYRIEDMVGETAVARAADLVGGVLITHLIAPNWARW